MKKPRRTALLKARAMMARETGSGETSTLRQTRRTLRLPHSTMENRPVRPPAVQQGDVRPRPKAQGLRQVHGLLTFEQGLALWGVRPAFRRQIKTMFAHDRASSLWVLALRTALKPSIRDTSLP